MSECVQWLENPPQIQIEIMTSDSPIRSGLGNDFWSEASVFQFQDCKKVAKAGSYVHIIHLGMYHAQTPAISTILIK